MNKRIFESILLCALFLLMGSCKKSTPVSTTTEQKSAVPIVCVYTLGAVNENLQRAMMDSLRVHYPKCRMVGNIHLPDSALTTERNDHKRYRADVLKRCYVIISLIQLLSLDLRRRILDLIISEVVPIVELWDLPAV